MLTQVTPEIELGPENASQRDRGHFHSFRRICVDESLPRKAKCKWTVQKTFAESKLKFKLKRMSRF